MQMSRVVIGRLSIFLGKISRIANTAGTLVVLALVAVLIADVIARGAFTAPIRGVYEVVQFSMALIVFLQLPDVVRVNRLTRSDGFLAVLGDTRPKLAQFFVRLVDGVSAVFMVLIVIAMWPEFVEAWESNDYFGTPGIFTAPWWPVKGVIVLSAALCALLFACKTIAGTRDPEYIHQDNL